MTDGPQRVEYTPELIAAIEEARDELDKAIKNFVSVMRDPAFPGDAPYVQAWAVALEWTNIWSEQTLSIGPEIIAPNTQLISTTAGLGKLLTRVL